MKKSRFSEEHIVGILKQHESEVNTALAIVCDPATCRQVDS